MKFLYFSKCICVSLLLVSALTLSQGDFIKSTIDDAIYKAIYGVLLANRPDQPALVKCMVDDFKSDKIADKFYSPDLLINSAKLEDEIRPYVYVAEAKCKAALFIQSPVGIIILIAVLLLLILCSCCIIKCLCC